jgi:arylsulfatase A-like enzyme
MPPVVYVDVDSLRSDHVGAYGYSQPTTPHVDSVAADGVSFERAYVANSPCLPSRAAFLSGRYGLENGIETHGTASQQMRTPANNVEWAGNWTEQVNEDRSWWMLPELFFENRIETCAVSSFPRHPAPWFYHVWHQYRQPQEPNNADEMFQTVRGERVVSSAEQFLRTHAADDFFLYVQLWDPHSPLNRPESEVERFRDGDAPPFPTSEQIEDHQEWDAWRSATHMDVNNRDDLAELLAQYDAEIRYADEQIGRLLETLQEHGLYDETLLVVTADHGEEFGEHGLYEEHWSTFEGTQHIPLVVKPPASTEWHSGPRDHLVTNVDLPPTLADYAGLEPPARWQGRSLRPIIENPARKWRDHVVVDHGLYTAQRAVRTDEWKYIVTKHPGMWDGVTPEEQLYRVVEDPWEQNERANEHPEVVQQLRDVVSAWTDNHLSANEDALETVARDGPAGYLAFSSDWSGV